MTFGLQPDITRAPSNFIGDVKTPTAKAPRAMSLAGDRWGSAKIETVIFKMGEIFNDGFKRLMQNC